MRNHHGHASDPSHRGVFSYDTDNVSYDTLDDEFSGAWVSYHFSAEHCPIESLDGSRKKQGWKLRGYLIYCDHKYRLWIAEEGYLWDGPSYPSVDSGPMGRLLKWLVGDRKKRGLLASSAIHDKMVSPATIIQTNKDDMLDWQGIANIDQLKSRMNAHEPELINISIPEAARIYYHMLKQWPNDDETITILKQIKQYIGLLIFQPLYRLFITGPSKTIWKEIIQ